MEDHQAVAAKAAVEVEGTIPHPKVIQSLHHQRSNTHQPRLQVQLQELTVTLQMVELMGICIRIIIL